jgi:predicted nucleic acid-binding protein
MGRVLALDSGAIIALARGDAYAAALVQEIREDGGSVAVPAPVLAEVLRGGRSDAAVHRVLNAIDYELTTTPRAARAAGAAIGRVRGAPSLTLDALIVETAVEHGTDGIMTQDLRDMRALAAGRLVILPSAP